MKLTSGQIQDVKRAIIKEVKDLEYGTRGINSYVTLENIDLDLEYTLQVADVVNNGLTLVAYLDYYVGFYKNGNHFDISNPEDIEAITIKLW